MNSRLRVSIFTFLSLSCMCAYGQEISDEIQRLKDDPEALLKFSSSYNVSENKESFSYNSRMLHAILISTEPEWNLPQLDLELVNKFRAKEDENRKNETVRFNDKICSKVKGKDFDDIDMNLIKREMDLNKRDREIDETVRINVLLASLSKEGREIIDNIAENERAFRILCQHNRLNVQLVI